MSTRSRARLVLVSVCIAAAVIAAGAQPASAPALTRAEMAHFLSTARIVGHRDTPKGVTRPSRLTLSDGATTHDAAFSDVDEHDAVMRFRGGRTELDFVDSWRYNIAAYQLAQLLSLDGMMPVTVERKWERRTGSLSWWLDVMMDEDARIKAHIEPPNPTDWIRQMSRLHVFAQLVADTDRNTGNILIDRQWRVWMIDFTRAFRRTHEIVTKHLGKCDRELLSRLRDLNRDAVKQATRSYLNGSEIDALFVRRDLLVKHFERLVAERGEAAVLY